MAARHRSYTAFMKSFTPNLPRRLLNLIHTFVDGCIARMGSCGGGAIIMARGCNSEIMSNESSGELIPSAEKAEVSAQYRASVPPARPARLDRAAFSAARWHFGIVNQGSADLLFLLLKRRGRPLSRTELADQLHLTEATVSAYMSTLRSQLKKFGLEKTIETIRSRGYRISPECGTTIIEQLGLHDLGFFNQTVAVSKQHSFGKAISVEVAANQ